MRGLSTPHLGSSFCGCMPAQVAKDEGSECILVVGVLVFEGLYIRDLHMYWAFTILWAPDLSDTPI